MPGSSCTELGAVCVIQGVIPVGKVGAMAASKAKSVSVLCCA